MFRRLLLEDWTQLAALLSFALIFFVFVTSAARALLLPKKKVKYMASLPLEDGESAPSQKP